MLSAIGRATAQQARVGGGHVVRHTGRLTAQLTASRAALVVPAGIRVAAVFSRGYAQGTAAKDTTATKRTPAAKKSAAKKTAAKKTTTEKKPAASKTVKPNSKTAGKGRGRPKKPLTEAEKLKKALEELKQKALLQEEPKRLPTAAYTVFTIQRFNEIGPDKVPGREGFVVTARQIAEEYRNLTPAELEKFQAIAQQNKVANEVARKNFVESRTPQEIREANLARFNLRKKLRAKSHMTRMTPFDDPRYPTRPLSPYHAFFMSRVSLPEFDGLPASKRTVAVAEQYKNLSAEERKPFEEIAATDKARWEKEIAAYNQAKAQQ